MPHEESLDNLGKLFKRRLTSDQYIHILRDFLKYDE